MRTALNRRNSIFHAIAFALVLSVTGPAVTGQEVDVYFVVGQSNAANFASNASTGSTNVGFELHFARTSNSFNNFPNHTAVAQQFSSSNLSATVAPTILATDLRSPGNDVGIFSFARNGAGLNNNTTSEGDPWIWYPGADPANGQLFNDSMYANAIAWNEARMAPLRNSGRTLNVKGIFWLQGEKDGRLMDGDVYQANLENLAIRFRQDYGEDLPIVVTQIREIQTSYEEVNLAAQAAAASDPFMAYVSTEDLPFLSNANNNNVHLTSTGHALLASRWSSAMLNLQIALGDVDRNGSVDFLDISPFIAFLTAGDYSREADVDRNGYVDFLDISPFISALGGN